MREWSTSRSIVILFRIKLLQGYQAHAHSISSQLADTFSKALPSHLSSLSCPRWLFRTYTIHLQGAYQHGLSAWSSVDSTWLSVLAYLLVYLGLLFLTTHVCITCIVILCFSVILLFHVHITWTFAFCFNHVCVGILYIFPAFVHLSLIRENFLIFCFFFSIHS